MKSVAMKPQIPARGNHEFPSNPRRRGFTLVEVAVVVAIIALSALLIGLAISGGNSRAGTVVSFISNVLKPGTVTAPGLPASVDADGRFTAVPRQIIARRNGRFEFTLTALPANTSLNADGFRAGARGCRDWNDELVSAKVQVVRYGCPTASDT